MVNNNKYVKPESKKKFKIVVIIAAIVTVLIIAAAVAANKQIGKNETGLTPNQIADYNRSSGRAAVDEYMNALKSGDGAVIGSVLEDSWVAKEWNYVGGFAGKKQLLEAICYACVAEYVQIMPDMVADENNFALSKINLTVPDYSAVAVAFTADKEAVCTEYMLSGISPLDYEFNREMIVLFTDWLVSYIDKNGLPVKDIEIEPSFIYGAETVLGDDIAFSKALFSGDDFMQMCDSVSKLILDYEVSRGVIRDYEAKSELVLPYTWLGVYYAENEYEGVSIALGGEDGSREYPAGVGTGIVTKVLCKDGEYHDVRITLSGVWFGDDAVKYAQSLDVGNVGVLGDATKKFMCYELLVENLEGVPAEGIGIIEPAEESEDSTSVSTVTAVTNEGGTVEEETEDKSIEFELETYLADSFGNVSIRVGVLYGFIEEGTVPPGESVTFRSWWSSPDLFDRYFCWGKSFERKYPVVWFDVLKSDSYN